MKQLVLTGWLLLLLGGCLLLAPARAAAQALRGTFAAGETHSLSIHADGSLWATGNNTYGQLGTGTTTASSRWVQVGTATNWVQVAVSFRFSLGLQADGSLWAWGDNQSGQLGLAANAGTSVPISAPTRVGTATYTQVAANGGHTLALRPDGTLWAWGSNYNGQLGNLTNLGTNTANPTPTQVGTATYTQVAAGYAHSLALRADGTLWAWGYNLFGQLGLDTYAGTAYPTPTPTQVGPNTYTQVAAGFGHSLALRADGSLWSWGYNYSGQLGNPTNNGAYTANPVPTRVGTDTYTQVAAGYNHSLGLRPDGSLWAWGHNYQGQLGNPTNSGSQAANPTPMRAGPGVYVQAVAGQFHSLGLQADGVLYGWGSNYNGQLGTAPTTTLVATPTASTTALPTRSTAAGSAHGLAVKADGTLWAWGSNRNGQLGDGTTTASLKPHQIGPDRDWVMVAAGGAFSLGLKADGSLWAWGRNLYGELGSPAGAGTGAANPTPTRVGTDLYIRVLVGNDHCLALRADGSLWAWGHNYYGQLGTLTNIGASTANPVPARVGTDSYTGAAAGGSHSLALRADGTLWAWGNNGNGQLGNLSNNGTANANPLPSPVGTATYRQVAAGDGHSLALRADGSLWAWGHNYSGQLGNPTNAGTTNPNPLPTQVGTVPYARVAAGTSHSLGLRADGTIWAWGDSYFGALGGGTNSTGPTTVPTQEATSNPGWTTLASSSSSHSSLARVASGLYFASTGLNGNGQLGDGTITNANRFDRLSPLTSYQLLPVRVAAAATSFTLSPNPASGLVQVAGLPAGELLTVYDALGRLARPAAASLDVSGLPAGVYLVRSGGAAVRLVVQ